jgi:HlyD family secretion protein
MRSRISRSIRKREFWLGTAVCVALAAVLLTSVSGCGSNAATAKGDPSLNPEALPVIVTTPQIDTIRRSIVQPGVIKSYEETPIYAKLAGFLRDVYVDIGDRRRKGELLGQLWVPEVEEDVHVKYAKIIQGKADVKQSKESLEAAKANVQTMEAMVIEAEAGLKSAIALVARWDKEYTNDMELVKKGILDQQTADEAKNQFNSAEAGKVAADAKLDSSRASLVESKAKRDKAKEDVDVSEQQLNVWDREYQEQVEWFKYAKIEAPYDGIVTRRNVHTDHFVQPANSGTTSKGAEPLFMFMRTDQVRVIVQVPERNAPLVKDGADAIVRVPSLKGREIPCKVKRSSWSLDTESRTLRVEIFLDNPLKNPNEELQAGMYVNVSIMADLPNVLTLPIDSILIEGTQTYCYLAEDGKVKRVNVQVGVANDRYIQILSKQLPPAKEGEEGEWVPFTGNEKVIISSLASIRDGQPISIK